MIDCRDYDIALVERIKTFYKNTHWIMRPNLPLQEIRDRKVLNGEDIDFPIITVRRTNCPIFSKEYNSWSRGNSGQSYYTGDIKISNNRLQNTDPELASTILNAGHSDAVSIVNSTFDLTYYIDVISLERDNFDTIMIELQENLFRIPYLGFYNLKSDGSIDKLVKDQACHLLVEEVEDTSDLENFDTGNALYRATITVKLNAYIYRKYKSKAIEQFNLGIDVIPEYLDEHGLMYIEDYVESPAFSKVLHDKGYTSLLSYIQSKGYKSLEDFIAALKTGKIIDVTLLGTDGITVSYKIPPLLDDTEVKP